MISVIRFVAGFAMMRSVRWSAIRLGADFSRLILFIIIIARLSILRGGFINHHSRFVEEENIGLKFG